MLDVDWVVLKTRRCSIDRLSIIHRLLIIFNANCHINMQTLIGLILLMFIDKE